MRGGGSCLSLVRQMESESNLTKYEREVHLRNPFRLITSLTSSRTFITRVITFKVLRGFP